MPDGGRDFLSTYCSACQPDGRLVGTALAAMRFFETLGGILRGTRERVKRGPINSPAFACVRGFDSFVSFMFVSKALTATESFDRCYNRCAGYPRPALAAKLGSATLI